MCHLCPPGGFTSAAQVNPYIATTAGGAGTESEPRGLTDPVRAGLSRPGTETVWLTSGVWTGRFVFDIPGITYRAAPGHHPVLDGAVTITAPGVTLRDIELRLSGHTNRTVDTGANIEILAADTSIINCLAFDGGVAIFSSSENVLVHGCITNGQGWQDGPADRGHGHSAYIQNTGPGRVTLDNNIFGPGFGWSAHAYAQTEGKLEAQTWTRNSAAGAGYLTVTGSRYPFLLAGSVASNDYVVAGNLCFGAGIGLYYTALNGALTFDGGRIDNPGSSQPDTAKWSPATVVSPALVNPGTLGVYVYPNDYETGRANITVFNPNDLSSTTADCTGIIGASDPWYLYDGFNPLAGPVSSGTGPTVTVPMAGLTCRTPAGCSAPTHPCPKFGAFVVRSTATWVAPV